MTLRNNNRPVPWDGDYNAYYDEDRSHDITLGWLLALFAFAGFAGVAHAARYAIGRVRSLVPMDRIDPPVQSSPPIVHPLVDQQRSCSLEERDRILS